MVLVTEGLEDGPTSKRELKEPAKIKKNHILIVIFWILYLCLFIAQEIGAAVGSFLWGLTFRREPKSLKGKVCLVTGAGRGLGREFCLALAKEGAVIACFDINEPNNKTTATMIMEMGAKAVPYTVNVAIKKDLDHLVCQVEKDLGPIYLLINNAAIVGNVFGIQEDFIRASFNTNVFGPTWLINAVLPSMKLRNEGHIVNISSSASKMVMSPIMIYGATKTALAYIGNCIRAELQLENEDNNIVVTNVHPSIINTSEDYTSSAHLNLNIVVEMSHVVEATMKAIHYNYDEVLVPSIMKYPLLLVNELMPSKTTTKLLKLFVKKIIIPTPEQYKNLPWHDLVKESCLMEKQDDK
ncbi:uncharacterized oxidoreductase YoxD [Halyomorpha halys]|uniref:uncharacterized oxidoreductase YoxD n=1 Tax=Halyomorpha halys TaxID=286706 RepID=UPI0006D4D79C|nr:uncharacterized protein LOC106690779 [Halyomorpha halys]